MPVCDQRLLNDYQHRFPLCSTPFACIGKELGLDASTVIARFETLCAHGYISRVGPVFRPNSLGASQLCAMATGANAIGQMAAMVNRFAEVNHNYEREHRLNLWFVVTGRDTDHIEQCVQQIESQTGSEVLRLPLLKAYHIDLGFPIDGSDNASTARATPSSSCRCTKPRNTADTSSTGSVAPLPTDASEGTDFTDDLIALVQTGLPLVHRPYRYLAERLDVDEGQVTAELRRMIGDTTIKRFGVVVRHHELGFRANAMVVWNVPDDLVDDLGERLGGDRRVSLCYRRPRVMPVWPYNLFCMLHGRTRVQVLQDIDTLIGRFGLAEFDSSTLFSLRRFKQRGARYRELSGARAYG